MEFIHLIFFTLAFSALQATALFLQKKGIKNLPELKSDLKIIKAYLTHPTWLSGILAQIAAGVGLFWVYGQGAVSVLQPISSSVLVFSAILGAVFLKEKLGKGEIMGITLIMLAVVFLGISKTTGVNQYVVPNTIGFVLMAALALAALLFYVYRRPGSSYHDVAWGTIAGLFSGLGTFMGEMFYINKDEWGIALAILVFMVPFTVFHISNAVSIQKGLKHGNLVNVMIMEDVVNKMIVISAGMLCLLEPLPDDTLLTIVRFAAFALVIQGVVMITKAKSGKQLDTMAA